MKRCGHDCDCPSKLHHEVSYVAARIAAPIPPPSVREIARMLTAALDESTEEEIHA